MDPERIDLAKLANRVISELDAPSLTGFVVGRTRIRDVVIDALGCSDTEAEQIVETMIVRGFLRFVPGAESGAPGGWLVDPTA